jgi:hypothetical protein
MTDLGASRLSFAPTDEKGMRARLTTEETARIILEVFKASGASANEVLLLGTVDRICLNRHGVRPSDFTFGLRHAIDMGWVEITGQGRQLRLTQSGFDAMLAKEPPHQAASRR